MKIINHHLGLPVICLDTSERVGDVLRFITDQVAGKIVAVAVAGEWYQEPSGVAVEDCTAFGQNVVLVNRRDSVRPLSEMDAVRMHLQASNDARQRTAITESGKLLGSITDEAFDDKTGEVTGYRLDILADSGAGRTVYVPHTAFMTASATVAILKDDVLEVSAPSLEMLAGTPVSSAPADIETAPGAFAGAETLSYGASPEHADDESEVSASHPVYSAYEKPPVNAEEPTADSEDADSSIDPEETAMDPALVALSEKVMDDGAASTAPPPVSAPSETMEAQERVMMALVVGKIAGAMVTDSANGVLVEEGQAITMEMAESVRAAGKLYEVWMSAKEEE